MTLEDDAEQLDWGNEDDEQMTSELRALKADSRIDPEDAEDAISLGSQEGDNDDVYVYQPRPQQDTTRGFSTPKSTSFSQQQPSQQATRELQRENSTNSQKQFSHSQGSPQQSPHRSSFSKITHALPPKPVVSSVPFMHPSHPSIIEATAMARGRSDRDKKANGSSTKAASASDAGEHLPPDWEVRQPRSGGHGIYYYNVRTHESTWTRPVHGISSRDKERGRAPPPESRSVGKLGFDNTTSAKPIEQSRRPEADSQVSSVELTYEDRHYRPGADSKPSIDSSKRDERPSQVPTYDPNPFTPSVSPKPDQPHSPHQRSRDPDRFKRSGRQVSPHHSPDGRVSTRTNARDNTISDAERRWGPSREPPPPAVNSSRRRAISSHTRQQDRDVDMPLSTTPAFEERISHNDTVWSSAPRHRSPPYIHEVQTSYAPQASQAIVLAPQPTTTSMLRQKSRFDRPSQNASRSRDHDVYVPVDPVSKRDGEHELTFAQIDTENSTKRMDVDDHERDTVSNHRAFQAEPTLVSLPERSISASPSHPDSQAEQSRQLKRHRHPLPPQSTRFRDTLRTSKDPGSPVLPSPVPPGPGFGGIVQRSTVVNNNVPSGPRLQPQPQPVRDASHPDFAHGARVPPSGPSANVSNRVRPPRSSNETVFTPNESPALRDRDSMDVDSVPQSRAAPPRTNDAPIRAGSGMYADREQTNDALPKAPRAMAKVPVGTHLPPANSPSTSPTTPFSAQRSISGHEYVSDRRERSPPLHHGGHDGWEQPGGLPERRYSQPVSTTVRPDPAWRSEIPRDDARTGPVQETEINQIRGEQSNTQTRRQNELSRQPPSAVLKLSGTNSVPIGSRKGGANSQAAMPSPVAGGRRGPLSGSNAEPVRGRVSRGGAQPKESYERSPQFGFRSLAPGHNYRTAESVPVGHRRRSGHSPQPFERGPPPPVDTSPPVRSYYAPVEPSRYERLPSPEPPRSASRVWMPRVPSPGHATRGGDYRASTPPLSREPPSVSPTWEGPSFGPSDHTRPTGRYSDNTRLQNRIDTSRSVMVTDHHPRRQDIVVDRDRDRERFGPDAVRSGGLQERLGERYDERYAESGPYRSHPSPLMRRQLEEYLDGPPRQVRSDGRRRSYSFGRERVNDDWASAMEHREPNSSTNLRPERMRLIDDISSLAPDDPPRMSKPIRIRRNPSTPQPRQSFDNMPMHSDVPLESISLGNSRGRDRGRDVDRGLPDPPRLQERPHVMRRGGSLLDRLSLDDPVGPISLRERVQIPMKRDREDMSIGDSHSVDAFDYDDIGGDSAAKRIRRRNTKVRRGKKN